MNVSVGQQFPNFSGRTHDGQYFDLDSLADKNVVVYFYPKDDTPGCTVEAQEFSHLLHQFHKVNTEVIGISVDSLETHKKFTSKYTLKVPLISDNERHLVEKLGIKREIGSAMRTTFILDGQGRTRKIYENVNPHGHAQEVLNQIKNTMQSERKETEIKKIIKKGSALSEHKEKTRKRIGQVK